MTTRRLSVLFTLPTLAVATVLAAWERPLTQQGASYLAVALIMAARPLVILATGVGRSMRAATCDTGVAVMGRDRGMHTPFARQKCTGTIAWDMPAAFMYTSGSVRQHDQGQDRVWNRMTPYTMN